MAFYNLDEIKDIPIEQVLYDYGKEVNRHGFFKLRDEQTASAKIYEHNNSFYDFGSHTGGSVIQLVKEIEGLDNGNAVQTLGGRYGLEDISQSIKKGEKLITDRQYLSISVDQKELGISMNKLFTQDPSLYSDILKEYALPSVTQTREDYFYQIKLYLQMRHDHGEQSLEAQYRYSNIEDAREQLSKEYRTLLNCVKGTRLNIRPLKPDIEKDILRCEEKFEPIDWSQVKRSQPYGIIRPGVSGVKWDGTLISSNPEWYDGLASSIKDGSIPHNASVADIDKNNLREEDIVVIVNSGIPTSQFWDGRSFTELSDFDPTKRQRKSDVLDQVNSIKTKERQTAVLLGGQITPFFEMG